METIEQELEDNLARQLRLLETEEKPFQRTASDSIAGQISRAFADGAELLTFVKAR